MKIYRNPLLNIFIPGGHCYWAGATPKVYVYLYILVPLKQFYNLGSRILISLFTEIWDVYTALSVVNLGAGWHKIREHTQHI